MAYILEKFFIGPTNMTKTQDGLLQNMFLSGFHDFVVISNRIKYYHENNNFEVDIENMYVFSLKVLIIGYNILKIV